MPSVFFYVQHLWGVGHVYRATRIAKGLANKGFEVHLVWGGTIIPGFDFEGIKLHRLPAVRTSDASFSQLLHADGSVFTDEDKAKRCEKLIALFDDIRPDILITEAFPFGRRQMRFELLPLLEHVSHVTRPPMLAASIRDIMQENRKEKRVAESNALIEEYFDLVLVHGDERFIPIEETLQGADAFNDKIRYTGLVTPEEPKHDASTMNFECDVLVSVGGGAFGQNLTRIALEAMQHCKSYSKNWIVSAGTEMLEDDFTAFENTAPDGMRIVRNIPDLAAVMKNTGVSVSHAGYNTVADILRTKCRSVLYPYTGGRETEQLRRAQIMQDQGIAIMVDPDSLSPEILAKCVDRACQLKPRQIRYDLDGTTQTADILAREFIKYERSLVN